MTVSKATWLYIVSITFARKLGSFWFLIQLKSFAKCTKYWQNNHKASPFIKDELLFAYVISMSIMHYSYSEDLCVWMSY